MTKVITIFSCANDVHKIVIIRWRNVGVFAPGCVNPRQTGVSACTLGRPSLAGPLRSTASVSSDSRTSGGGHATGQRHPRGPKNVDPHGERSSVPTQMQTVLSLGWAGRPCTEPFAVRATGGGYRAVIPRRRSRWLLAPNTPWDPLLLICHCLPRSTRNMRSTPTNLRIVVVRCMGPGLRQDSGSLVACHRFEVRLQ